MSLVLLAVLLPQRLGQIFEIKPAAQQKACIALFLRYWCFAIVYVYERTMMDTISTIVWPSITLLCPLVGGSLASDIGADFRNQTGCPTMYHLNVEVYNHSPSYILVIPLCICI